MNHLMVILLLLLSFIGHAQDCNIKLTSGETSYGSGDNVGMQFELKLKDTTLVSTTDGVLIIPKKYFDKNSAKEVKFSFYKIIDNEYYRLPMFTRTRRTLSEYCGQSLVAASRRW